MTNQETQGTPDQADEGSGGMRCSTVEHIAKALYAFPTPTGETIESQKAAIDLTRLILRELMIGCVNDFPRAHCILNDLIDVLDETRRTLRRAQLLSKSLRDLNP